MAMWDKITSRGNVEDRRGASGFALGGGGLGVGGIVLFLALNYLNGGSVLGGLTQLATQSGTPQQIGTSSYDGNDAYQVFASQVLGSDNDMWTKILAQNNKTYHPPKLVLFRGYTQSACGGADAQAGPHYCPNDQTIYLDETFFEELTSRFGAKGGDVAEAYVIAHEVGHHAQNELGIFDQHASAFGQDNQTSVQLELQADCFAGMWANSLKDRGVFQPGEISEAIDAASAVGDDRIQKETTGAVHPETWTHGSSEQRVSWFNRGYASGSLSQCNTFGNTSAQ